MCNTMSDSTIDRILDAALNVFPRLGVLGSTMEDVARAAGVSRVTVYRYFAGKEGLVTAVCARLLGPFQSGAQSGDKVTMTNFDQYLTDILHDLRRVSAEHMLSSLAEIQRGFPQIYATYCQQRQAAVIQIFESCVRAVRKAGRWRDELNLNVVRAIFESTVLCLGENPTLISSDISYPELCSTVIGVFRDGVLRPEADVPAASQQNGRRSPRSRNRVRV